MFSPDMDDSTETIHYWRQASVIEKQLPLGEAYIANDVKRK